MTSLIWVRHGQSTANVAHLLQGQSEGELTEIGRQQAQQLGQHLRDFKIDHFISSDLARAKETAQIIVEQINLPLELSPHVREWKVGHLDGQPAAALENAFEMSAVSKADYKPENGESLNDLRNRAKGFCDQLIQQHTGKNVLICSHGDFIRMSFSALLDRTLEDALTIELHNCSYSILENDRNGQWHLKSLNNRAHLS
ncbi:MAG: histidine phosphatase family protein [Chloroflexi bacterium]|nr:MAG: histidine phosphatase family protein [Chloroflexota bacterium]MBL1192971.1 histidine phosphatase family protein [Chloroflexota bacterium]NOH10263.1 histidine phosphatase family protein [Chloroflexota bacterium]